MNVENTKDYISFYESQKDAPLVMLVHGFPNNALMWQEQIKFLRNDYHLLAINLPGAWLGEEKSFQDYNIKIIGEKLAEILSKKSDDKKKVFIVGHDLGAFIAHEVSKHCSENLSGVVYISGMPATMFKKRLSSVTQCLKSFYVFLFNFSCIRKFAKNKASNLLVKIVYKLSSVPTNSFLWISASKGFGAIDLYRQMTTHVFKVDENEINTNNSLFIFGEDEKFLNLPTESEIRKTQKKSSLKILPGGHWLPATHPEQVNNELSDFFLKALSV